MKAMQETTVWEGATQPNHIYLLDGDKAVAYIPWGTGTAQYFKKPLRLDLRGRQFTALKVNPFEVPADTTTITVQGSNGKTYEVDPEAKTCTCPGYTFRGQCRHVAEALGEKVLDKVVQNVVSKAKKDLTKSAKGATILKLDVTKSIQDFSTNCRNEDFNMSNDNKLFTVVGTSTFKGQSKVRFTNDIAVRIKTLVKGGHTNVELIELPKPMTKAEAVAYLEANTPKGIDMDAVSNKGSDIGRKVKSSAIKTPVSKVAKAPVAETKAA